LEADPPVQFCLAVTSDNGNDSESGMSRLDRLARAFEFRRGGRFFFIGDKDAVLEARGRTLRLMNERGRDAYAIDMEPFEVLRDIIREGKHPGVGGAPQIAKVYQYMNSGFFATLWEHEQEIRAHVFGRPVLPLESCAWPAFDPESLIFKAQTPPRQPTSLELKKNAVRREMPG
jgi:hypothetical protein